jgi:hypothetical protein
VLRLWIRDLVTTGMPPSLLMSVHRRRSISRDGVMACLTNSVLGHMHFFKDTEIKGSNVGGT